MLSVISFIGVLSVLVVVHEFGHFFVAKKIGVKVEKFSVGFGPEIIGKTINETRYAISMIPLGGYVKLAGEPGSSDIKGEESEYISRSVGERARIIFAGPLLNYLLAFLLFSFIFIIGSPTLTSTIGGVMEDYPAESIGLKEGDKIIKIKGEEVKYWEEVTHIVHTNKDYEIDIVVERDGELIDFSIEPKTKEIKTLFGKKKAVGLLGITPSEEVINVRYDFFKSFYMGGKKLISLTYLTCRALWASATGAISFKDSVTGPVGIFYITGKAAEMGIRYLLNIMAVLSMSLAIFNVLPIPVLDGGHLFFLLVEKLRKKPISIKIQENVSQIGFILLMALMLFVFYNDFMKFGIFEKIIGLFKK